MRFVDLFAGLGGFHLGAKETGAECVFASEINEELRTLYVKNFGLECKGDICNVDMKDVPPHELLCAGFPCQPFSKAGDQMGWRDKRRGTVFWKIVEILRVRKPKLVILENVAHFVRHDEGNTYQKVRRALEELGYAVDYRQYSPHQFGVPQIRERFYMVGIRGSLKGFKWPEPETTSDEVSIYSVLDTKPKEAVAISKRVEECIGVWQDFLDAIPATTKLPSFPIWSMEFGATYRYTADSLSRVPLNELQGSRGSFGHRLELMNRMELYNKVPSHARGGRGVFPRWKQLFIKQNRDFFLENRRYLQDWLPCIQEFPSSLQKLEWNCQGEDRNLWKYILQFRASGVRVKRTNTAPSLVAMTTTQVPIIAWEKRYMTVRECARLQSMESLPSLPSGGAAAQALGNAVNVTVVRKILDALIPCVGAVQPKRRIGGTKIRVESRVALSVVAC